jgi:hypothetical protein
VALDCEDADDGVLGGIHGIMRIWDGVQSSDSREERISRDERMVSL